MSEPAVSPATTPVSAAEPAPANAAEAPRTMPATAPVAEPADADYSPAQDDAAGFAAFRAAKGEPAADASAKTESGKADVVAAAVADATGTTTDPAAPKAEVADPTDAKLNKIFNRIAHLERERDEARSSLSRLEQRAARADELERLEAEMKANPTKALERLGWNQDTLAEYILKGNDATSPKLTAVEQEQRALKQELEQLRAERAEADRQERIRKHVAALPDAIKDELPELKHVSTFYDSPAEMAEAIWQVQRNAYQTQKTELSPVEAAQAIEKVLAEQAKRFARASSQSPAPSNNASAPKPAASAVPQTLTNRATAAPLPASAGDSDDHSPNYAAAVELLKAARK